MATLRNTFIHRLSKEKFPFFWTLSRRIRIKMVLHPVTHSNDFEREGQNNKVTTRRNSSDTLLPFFSGNKNCFFLCSLFYNTLCYCSRPLSSCAFANCTDVTLWSCSRLCGSGPPYTEVFKLRTQLVENFRRVYYSRNPLNKPFLIFFGYN